MTTNARRKRFPVASMVEAIVGFTKINRNRKQASRHFSIVSHLKKQH